MQIIAAFYKFAPLPDFAERKGALAAICGGAGVKGSILLAPEGVNGTIAGARAGVDAVLAALRAMPGFADLDHKESTGDAPPFGRMKVRLKREIVTMGVDGVDGGDPGVYVAAEDWNALIAQDDVALIDVRNAYEIEIGAFEGAINPQTVSFGEFPAWLRKFHEESAARKVAMYCTGGIRCEKATAFAKSIGFEEVYHLKGGILKYLVVAPEATSKWRGACYVFDTRVSVRHGLAPGGHVMCRACGMPVAPTDERHACHPGVRRTSAPV